jgi:hypothetical protein
MYFQFYAMRWTKLNLTCIYFQKKLTHCCFKFSPFNCSSWIDRVNFLHFLLSKIRISSTDVVFSISPSRCRLSFGRCHHVVTPCHAYFPWSQDELVAYASSFGNVSLYRLSSRVEFVALNLQHCRQPPSSDSPTPTLNCYKKCYLNRVSILPYT